MSDLQERIDAIALMPEPTPYREWLSVDGKPCCVEGVMKLLGCSPQCVMTYAQGWYWHGVSGDHPTPETICSNDTWVVFGKCPVCYIQWGVGNGLAYILHRHGASISASGPEPTPGPTYAEYMETVRS